jgi:hypothetical protein
MGTREWVVMEGTRPRCKGAFKGDVRTRATIASFVPRIAEGAADEGWKVPPTPDGRCGYLCPDYIRRCL